MKIFIQSCHAALEMDHCRTFLSLGHEIQGNWDIGSKERPKIEGITDHNGSMEGCDVVILHQVPKYPHDMEELLKKGKRVILSSFGQSDTWQFEHTGRLTKQYPHAWISPYSKTCEANHLQHGADKRKVRMIRFGKQLTDFEPWIGDGGYIYAACNSVHKRGNGCGWVDLEQVMKRLPILLSGVATEEVGGLGQITEPEMRERFRDAAGFISFGTRPAPMTLGQIESWCAGTPTAIWDNGHGISREGFAGFISPNLDDLINECDKLLDSADYRHMRHLESMENRKQFDNESVSQQWQALLEEVMS